jgi:hypothetical protein
MGAGAYIQVNSGGTFNVVGTDVNNLANISNQSSPRNAALAVPEVGRVVSDVLAEVDAAAGAVAEGRNLRDLLDALGSPRDSAAAHEIQPG